MLNITDIRVLPVTQNENPRLKAFVTLVIDNSFLIRDIKVIEGIAGLFLAMPAKKQKDGSHRDIAHPLNNETRQYIQDKVFEAYHKAAKGE